MKPTDVSVVVCTYNRAEMLGQALRSILAQKVQGFSYQVIVIDNNSSDDTPEVAKAFQADAPIDLRYFREVRQGNAYARNTGVAKAEASIVAFLDDDCIANEDWLATIKTAFDRQPELAFVGGRVLPVWNVQPPSWLTSEHWAPLALLDYGPQELRIRGLTPQGLLTANLAVRREVFQESGGFSPALQRVKDSIGSMEDHEFLVRICRSGKEGLYRPDLIAWAPVEPTRMTKAYHRRWHTGHGHFYAVLQDPEMERSRFRLAGVPGHVYRDMARQGVAWCSRLLRGNLDEAFASECRVRFCCGFVLERFRRRPTSVV